MADTTHLDIFDLLSLGTQEWLPIQGGVRVADGAYVNRVWSENSTGDPAVPGFVRWTTPAPDPTGLAYPEDRGEFGVDTSDYCVEARS